MPNDAKLGLIVGVGIVVVVAVVFFRKDQATAVTAGDVPAASVNRSVANPPQPRRGLYRSVRAKPAANGERRHTVQEGETLFSLAERYLGDKKQFVAIYEANRAVLDSPDTLPAGTELVIPNPAADEEEP